MKAVKKTAGKAVQRTKRKPRRQKIPRYRWKTHGLIAGVDEAGRGALAGPVVAAAVILDENHPIEGLRDSKTISEKKREQLFEAILAKAVDFCIAQASAEEIAQYNILHATMLAMQRAVSGLRLRPQLVLVDGNRLPELPVPAEAVVQGDRLIGDISAAGILAKVHRDAICRELDAQYPGYGFARHKAYGTQAHRDALWQLGACPAHRRGYAPVDQAIRQHEGMTGQRKTAVAADGDGTKKLSVQLSVQNSGQNGKEVSKGVSRQDIQQDENLHGKS